MQRSAGELQAAGVRFDNEPTGMFDVSFESGLLRLPQLTVNDKTETFFRNVIAFEQCGYNRKHISSYIIFMARLINTAEDVELLVKHGIIENLLGKNELVANLFNNLYKEVVEEQTADKTSNDLDGYSKDIIHKWNARWLKWKLHKWLVWKVILMDRYLNNPWVIISVVAAAIIVVLTIVQAVCAILGLKK
ncbi:hypothetical protein AgCh_018602 [Apium graveolens]